MPFLTTWMNVEGIVLSKMSDRERQMLYNLIYMWNIKKKSLKKQHIGGYQGHGREVGAG